LHRRVGQAKGRQVDPDALAAVERMIGELPRRRDQLIESLHRIQDACGHLSHAHLAALAQAMRLSQAEVYEVATFYHHFDVVRENASAPPAITVRVCTSLSCELAGSASLMARLADLVGEGVRIQPVPCVGRCDRAPVAVVGRRPIEAATEDALREALADARTECPVPAARGLQGDLAEGGYRALRALADDPQAADDAIARIEAAGLRGMGGAGFPAARKWRAVMAQPGPRLMVVNADEGEPGTFKDRHLLETEPHRVLEGMLIAARVTGCEACYLYLRDEYAGVRALLERELAALQADPPVPGLPRIELRRGAGAYICGEESALVESIEGKRGMPRLRPPYIAERGLFGRPTLAHNVETLYWIPAILAQGPQWYAAQGRRGRHGLRAFSVSGRVRSPGVKIAPAGISLRELVDEHCSGMAEGHTLYGYLPGGASGGILPASLADLPLDFDTLQPHGCFIGSAAIIVLSQHDSARAAALNLMRFFRAESCGQCTPCRVGTAKAVALMERPAWDRALLGELAAVMADASICGLGQAAPNPLMCAIRYFPQEFA
jgi:formate dehydrogenase